MDADPPQGLHRCSGWQRTPVLRYSVRETSVCYSRHLLFDHVVTVCSTGDRRFRLPEAIDPYTGTYDATKQGLSCPQQAIKLPLIPGGAVDGAINFVFDKVYGAIDRPDGEDCMRTFSLITAPSLTQGIRSKLECCHARKR